MTRIQRKKYNIPIKNYKKARRKSIRAEKKGQIPSYEIGKNDFLLKAWDNFTIIFKLTQCNSLDMFNQMWNNVLNEINASDWSKKDELCENMIEIIPNCGFTSRNYNKIPKKVGNLWRKIIRAERKKFEKSKGHFIKAKYTILMNPTNMNKFNKKMLREYLNDYPWLQSIRKAIRIFHYQFRAPRTSWRSLSFLRKIVKEDSHSDLKSAINTLVENEDKIFAYRRIWDEYPHLRGNCGIRSNHEQVNRKINMVSRNQFGFRDTCSARHRLEGILKCPIMVSKHLLAYESEHL
jgi:Transposase